MSLPAIRQALETRLAALAGVLPTVWEGTAYNPTTGTAHQRVFLMPATPANPSISSAAGTIHTRERGYLQVTLYYPDQVGPGAVETEAQRIRAHYPRGLSLTAAGVTVTINATPEIGVAPREAGWTKRTVSIPYFADVFG